MSDGRLPMAEGQLPMAKGTLWAARALPFAIRPSAICHPAVCHLPSGRLPSYVSTPFTPVVRSESAARCACTIRVAPPVPPLPSAGSLGDRRTPPGCAITVHAGTIETGSP